MFTATFTLPELYALLGVLGVLPANGSPFADLAAGAEAVVAAEGELLRRRALIHSADGPRLDPAIAALVVPAVFPELLGVISVVDAAQAQGEANPVYMSLSEGRGAIHQMIGPDTCRFERCTPESMAAWAREYLGTYLPAQAVVDTAAERSAQEAMRRATQIGTLLIAQPAEPGSERRALGWFVSDGQTWIIRGAQAATPARIDSGELRETIVHMIEKSFVATL